MAQGKIVFLHKRASGLDVEAFHKALATLAESLQEIDGLTGYVQSHTLLRGYSKGELLFDAVEEFSFADDASLKRFASDVEARLGAARAELVDPAASHRMQVEVHRVKDLEVPEGAVKNIEFVNRRPGMELHAFRDYWRNVHGPIGSHIPTILRYEQNHLALSEYEGASEPRYDGLAITWFESTAAMRAGAETEAYRITREDEVNFLPDGHLPIIIVNEVIKR
jgi:conserved hypothetical protein